MATASIQFADTFTRPTILSTDSDGIILNGFEAGRNPIILAGFNLPHRGLARVYMVRSQAEWRTGDRFEPVRLESGRVAQRDVELEDGRFRELFARPRELAPGSYDFIVRALRYGYEDAEVFTVRASDVISSRRFTGLVVRQPFMDAKAVLGGCVNVDQMSGRGISGPPYFQYTNTFEIGEDIYGALDPNALDPNNESKMVALYVIQHKNSGAWAADSSLNHLPQLGGNASVLTLKTQTSCINYNKRLLWSNASDVGEYDIVADFGNNVADSAAFVTDASFDAPLDMIDGYFVAGFRVIEDPTTHSVFSHAGKYEYTQATEGTVTVNDDLSTGTVVPMNAVVYFPADATGATTPAQISSAEASYPMFVAVHGQSGATNSYQGYNYLLEHMAKNGFIAASVHCIPGMQGTGRARVMFAHIDLLKTKFGSKAANNIGIMGHSRGGEAVAIAARLNQQDGLGHDIRAVILLAPTDQYTDEDVDAAPLLVVYGSMDGDVASPTNNGFRIYDRASTKKKSMIFVHGSTHGRYNTVWGDTDITAWWSKLGSTDYSKLIDADAHQKIAKGYMAAFCRWQQMGEVKWTGAFRGEWVPQAVAQANGGDVDLYVQYQDAEAGQRTIIDNFQGPHGAASWKTSTINDAVDDDDTLPIDPSQNELNTLDSHSPHDTGGLLLRWDQTTDHLRFEVPAGSRDVSGFSALSFRVTQKVDSTHNPVDQFQDLYVTLKDGSNKMRSIKVGKFGDIPPPHKREKNQYTLSAMTTIRVPLHVFTIKVLNTDEVNLSDVRSATFDFKATVSGELEIDSVEFTQ